MYNIVAKDYTKPIPWEEAFPDWEVGQHGQEKVGFEGAEGAANPTVVCVAYNSGGQLLEVFDFSTGDSNTAATAGGDRDVVVSRYPFASEGESGVLGTLRYRNGEQPELYVNGEEVVGGASRFSSFNSETGAADEDPKPRMVNDGETPEQYEVNRETGHAAWGDYFVTIRRLESTGEDAPLTLQHMGHNPETDITFPKPPVSQVNFCPHCGKEL
jgi:hypothetical protein